MSTIQEKNICNNDTYYVSFYIKKDLVDWMFIYQLYQYVEYTQTRENYHTLVLNSLTHIKIWDVKKEETIYKVKYWTGKVLFTDYYLEVFKKSKDNEDYSKTKIQLDKDWFYKK